MDKPFAKTPRQVEACRVLNSALHVMLFGGSRSGKTFIAIRNIFLRAMKRSSKHLIVRLRFNHARTSLCHETIPAVLRLCFPGVPVRYDSTYHFYELTAADGGKSQIWIGGTDDKERVEKILGNEYSTIYANECSQIPFNAILTLWTRLAETSGLKLRFYYDANPPGKKHWTHKFFLENLMPPPDGIGECEPLADDITVGHLQINPIHNLANLPPAYVATLEAMPKRYRERFLEGKFLSDIEGALWKDDDITRALVREHGDPVRTVIAVDPSVSNNANSDECGIVAMSIDGRPRTGIGIVHDDLSGRMSTNKWAQRVVNAYHQYGANEVVAEKNQGGDLVTNVIHSVDPTVKVHLVHASKGKFARAEPVAQLYEAGQDRIAHVKRLPVLESELTETVMIDVKESPNRMDALVWGATRLFKLDGSRSSRVYI